MNTTFVTYGEYMASLGWPDHHILVGPDWWGCICSDGGWDGDRGHFGNAGRHRRQFGADYVRTDWGWADIEDVGPTMADLHQWLWEQGAFG